MRTRDRFWALVDKRGPDECWEWQGSRNAKGYGSFPWSTIPSAETAAHRFAYVQANPPRIPKGRHVLHSCDNPPCCNPAHLRLGSDADNAADRVSRNRQAKGESHGLSKLNEEAVRAIRADPRTYREIAADYGVHPNKIGEVKRRVSWRHVE